MIPVRTPASSPLSRISRTPGLCANADGFPSGINESSMELHVHWNTMSSIGGSISILHRSKCLAWLALIERWNLVSADCLVKAQEDCTVVCRIIAASINTVKRRMKEGRDRLLKVPG
jgi:hypothetical protein